ncbi:hypothetical protein KAR91_10250 [Candidatus Pacearchaeota archaeon]|nr:hypothetical protein [Candidatus Pacearchaeota archaeon]
MVKVGCLVVGVLPNTFKIPAERLQKAFVSYCFVSSCEMVKVGCLVLDALSNTLKILLNGCFVPFIHEGGSKGKVGYLIFKFLGDEK